MSKYEYIMFDLDGTLIDPKVGQVNAVDYALKYFNINEQDKEKLCKFIGPPLKESFAKYYNFNDEQIIIGIEKYREYFLKQGIREANVYDGIIKMLKNLKANGQKSIIVTSNPTSFAEKIAEIYEFKDYMFDICGSNLDGSRVLKQEIIEYAISKNNIKDKTGIVMVGDRINDIMGAKNAKVDSIGVLYGYGSIEEMNEAMPKYQVKTVEELEDFLINQK